MVLVIGKGSSASSSKAVIIAFFGKESSTWSSQISRAFCVVLLHVMLDLLLCANGAIGKTIMVGGSSGWTNYDPKLGGIPNYQEWVASLTIEINDTLVFNMPYGGHTIDQFFDANAFAACNFSAEHREWAGPNITMFDATLKNTGQYYFACAIPGHCLQGQKLNVFVYPAAMITAPPAPAPSPELTSSSFQPTASPLGSPNSGPAAQSPARAPTPLGYPIRSPVQSLVVAPAGSPKASRHLVRPPAYAPASRGTRRPIAHHAAGSRLHL